MKEKNALLTYLQYSWRTLCLTAGICLAYNLYFVLLLQPHEWYFLAYLNVLVGAAAFMWFWVDYRIYCRQRLLDMIAAEETADLREEVRQSYNARCDLQDYIAKWCHEVKIPLAAALLLVEKLQECPERQSLRQQLERINSQMKNALLGCKVQSSLFDIKVRLVRFKDCVRESVHNNQFFLIHGRFEVQVSGCEEAVYTDKAWLVYVLDQLISNAIKYAGEVPLLKIWTVRNGGQVWLYLEDNGEGISEGDIRRIFEKGFTGQAHSNGQYKSTGMGLYMVKIILEKLGHGISVESKEGEFTRFCLIFEDGRECFFRS